MSRTSSPRLTAVSIFDMAAISCSNTPGRSQFSTSRVSAKDRAPLKALNILVAFNFYGSASHFGGLIPSAVTLVLLFPACPSNHWFGSQNRCRKVLKFIF